MLVSRMPAASNPHGVSVGASATVLAHVPTCPARLQRIDGSVQAVSQQTLVTQKPVEHCDGVEQVPPWGTGVLVGVAVGVLVGVCVGVFVGVSVGVLVGVCVGVNVAVGVLVGVEVGVFVGVSVGVSVGEGVGVGLHSGTSEQEPPVTTTMSSFDIHEPGCAQVNSIGRSVHETVSPIGSTHRQH
jgi:hypothetical protein